MKNTFLGLVKKGIPLSGGLRKRCFLIESEGKKFTFCLWPKESLPKEKILTAIKRENSAAKKGFPCRTWKKSGKSWIKKVSLKGKEYWLGMGTYLIGKQPDYWTDDHLFSAGRILARLHQSFRLIDGRTLLHLDFARGNVLFNQNKEVVGILDFEESQWGEPEKDLACSLSFLVVDNRALSLEIVWREFLKGYADGKGKFNYDKIEKYFGEFLTKRMEEGNREAFLLQARRCLESFQRQVKTKILAGRGLDKFCRKNRNKKIVLVVGAFELLHYGHLEFFQKAKTYGDLLLVGVASDESRQRLKGEPHPLITDRTRAETLAHFNYIDGTVIVPEDNVAEELKIIKPKIFYTVVTDWQEGVRKPEEEKLIKSWGGKVVMVKYLPPGISSSRMVEKVALLKMKQILWGKIRRQPMLKFKKGKTIAKEVKFKELRKLGEKIHHQAKTIVFTSLTADLFHLGHARFIQKAKSLGNILVVGVPSNKSVTALKGPGRPMIDERARSLVLSELDWVDWVVIFDERTVLGCLRRLKPDVFFTVKEDWNQGFLSSPEARFMKSIGGKIVRSERQAPYLSASKMIDKAAGELIQKKFSNLIRAARETPVLDADGFDPYSFQSQLTAREKGFYNQVLAEVTKRGKCVFCDLKEKYLIEDKDGVVLTVALFPYIDGHLLIIPRRHIERMGQLNENEQAAIFYLSKKGAEILKNKIGVENVWFLLREGNGIQAGKTVNHLHFHLIPYDPNVIKMGEKELSVTPLEMAEKLRKTDE